ncbi:hypothetical protein NVP1007O_62 [Vibrio phage 1.007.O._10N.261.55.F9]|nr:hypothetical protein NVP1007O_62 [Vibrio phage 1.007.O._10N.261.55.F9]
MKLTLKTCLARADELGIEIYGDIKKRGKTNAEDGELATFHQWVVYNYPNLAPVCFHPANEWRPDNNTTSFAHYNKMISKGYMPRLADWICLGVNGAPPLLIEMKKENIQESIASAKRKQHFIDQCELLHRQQSLGSVVCIALGAEAAKTAFKEYIDEYGKS